MSFQMESMILVKHHMPMKPRANCRDTRSSNLDSLWRTTRPDRRWFSASGEVHGGRHTLSRISTRSFTSSILSGDESLGDCSRSVSDIVDMVRELCRDLTPNLAGSLGTEVGKVYPRQWVIPAIMGIGTYPGKPRLFERMCEFPYKREGNGGRKQITPRLRLPW